MTQLSKPVSREVNPPLLGRATDPFYEMERLFDSFLPRNWMRPLGERLLGERAGHRLPSIDLIDRESELVVRCEMPGVSKEQLEVSTDRNAVTIRGSSRFANEDEKGEFYRCEMGGATFLRTIALPTEIDSDRAHAELKDGVLELTLPKRESARRHAITIQ